MPVSLLICDFMLFFLFFRSQPTDRVPQDKLNVEAFSDPKVKGVTLYLSDFSRPVADKLMNGDMFSGAAPCPPPVKFFTTSCVHLRSNEIVKTPTYLLRVKPLSGYRAPEV